MNHGNINIMKITQFSIYFASLPYHEQNRIPSRHIFLVELDTESSKLLSYQRRKLALVNDVLSHVID
jgi:hypothetical protein